MRFGSFTLAAFAVQDPSWSISGRSKTVRSLMPIPDSHDVVVVVDQPSASHLLPTTSTAASVPPLMRGIREWLVPSAYAFDPPSRKDIELLNRAMATFYNTKDLPTAQDLLTQTIKAWEQQPDDERASLYRIRAECYMGLLQPKEAQADYTKAIELLQTEEGQDADPSELPTAYLGRARAIRSQGPSVGKDMLLEASHDYQLSLRLSSREDWDTDQENEEDGATRNPYAAWEWGSVLRLAGKYDEAANAHALASQAFKEIGDRARSVIAKLDAGVDLAAGSKPDEAKAVLSKAIKLTTSVEGRDVALLQRVIAKEGEARMALASVLWDSNDRVAAETQFSDACTRLEELEADAQARNAANSKQAEPEQTPAKLQFSIDDQATVFEVSCSRFRNDKFLEETLQWPAPLRAKVDRLNNMGR